MPIYAYRCKECRHEFEELVMSASAEQDLVCPKCKAPAIERRMSTFATGKGGSTAAAVCSRGST